MGQIPELFPPPFGNANDMVRRVASQLGLSITSLLTRVDISFQAVIWNTDPVDYKIGVDPIRTELLVLNLSVKSWERPENYNTRYVNPATPRLYGIPKL